MVQSKAILASGIDGVTAFADRVYLQNISEVSGAMSAAVTTSFEDSVSGIVAAAVKEALQTEFERTAFGELKVAQQETQSYVLFPYGIESGLCQTSGIGNFTQGANSGMATITTPAVSSGKVVLSSRKHLRYIPSQGSLITITPIFQSGLASQKQLVGAGNDANGVFFGMSGSTGGIWWRSHGQENFITQSGWNVDNRLTDHDWTKGNVYRIQFQWLGFGQINFQIEDPAVGGFKNVHQIRYANTASIPTFLNASFPLRAEIDNNGTATARTLSLCCLDAKTEGSEGQSQSFAASGACQTSGALVNLLTIKNNTTFRGAPNNRALDIHHFEIIMDGNNSAFAELYRNAAISGTVYQDVHSNNSVVSYSTQAQLPTAMSGMMDGVFAFKNQRTDIHSEGGDLQLGPGETLSIVLRRVAGTSVDAYAFVHWKEFIG